LLLTIPTLLGLTALLFVLLSVVLPVDVIDIAVAESGSGSAAEQALREQYGFDGPLVVRYVKWLGAVVSGDLGESFFTGRSVTEELRGRVPVSVELGIGALIITVLCAIPIGMVSAAKQDSAADYLARGGAILFYAVPGFWVATLVLVFGSLWFNWAPATKYQQLWEDPRANVAQLVLPMLILGLQPIGTMVRLVRTQVLEVLRQDYVRTARAKGLSSQNVYFRHVLRNTMIPLVTVIGLQLPRLVAGTVIFETIFVLPGVGRYLLDSLQRLDFYVVLGTNLFFAVLLVVANLVVDISYGFIDPRIRLAK